MEQVDFFSAWHVTFKSNGPDKKERTKRNENVGMQKSANFTIVSTTLMIGLNIYNPLFSDQLPYNKISSELI